MNLMSKILELFEANHKASTAAKKASPEYNAVASEWLAGFQQNKNGHVWPEFAEKLLAACEAGKMETVKDCFWASNMNADLDPSGVPAIVAWGMKKAASIFQPKASGVACMARTVPKPVSSAAMAVYELPRRVNSAVRNTANSPL